jgi:hypothetical protein
MSSDIKYLFLFSLFYCPSRLETGVPLILPWTPLLPDLLILFGLISQALLPFPFTHIFS